MEDYRVTLRDVFDGSGEFADPLPLAFKVSGDGQFVELLGGYDFSDGAFLKEGDERVVRFDCGRIDG